MSLQKSLRKFHFSESSPKETSFFIPAGITVEAALALTMFIIFCAALLSMFGVLGRQITASYELELKSQKEAMYAEVLPEYDANILSVKGYSDSYLFVPAALTDTDVLLSSVRRAWTGRVLESADGEADETYVYVAQYGCVYHVSEQCTHLKLSIKQVSFGALSYLRTGSGARYKPCEKCCGDQLPENVFITDEGDKYHCSSGCSGLKRTYECIPLSECELPACSRCAGNGYD